MPISMRHGRSLWPGSASASHHLANAILAYETVTSGGEPVLAPGPWARATRLLNPSYFSPRAYTALAGRDARWAGVALSSRRLVDKLTAGGLAPDWAQLQATGIVPAGPPTGGVPPRYGYDAVRVAVRYAESCHPEDRALAARMWPRLRASTGTPVRGLDGSPQGSGEDPTALSGAAGAAYAAGDRRSGAALLDRADAAVKAHQTYYGSAWVALARTMLQTHALGRCRSSLG
jgi:endoglucanase